MSPILVLSLRDDADMLWAAQTDRLAKQLASWLSYPNGSRTLIIVWDKALRSDGVIDVGGWLTPIDWAVSRSWALIRDAEKTGDRAAVPDLRILIFDLSPRGTEHAFARGAFRSVAASLPWIRIYGARSTSLPPDAGVDDSAVIRSTKLQNRSLDDFLYDISRASHQTTWSSSLFDAAVSGANQVDHVAQFWVAALLSPAHRHHIGNYVAPLLLLDGVQNPPRSLGGATMARAALAQQLTMLGLLDTSASGAATRAPVPTEGLLNTQAPPNDVRTLVDGSSTRVLLIDDNAKNGFVDFVSRVLHGTKASRAQTITSETTPDKLLRTLRAGGAIADWREPRFLESSDLIFLDLRLWSTTDEAASVLSGICGAYDALKADQIGGSAVGAAYSAARRFISNRQGGFDPLALALLPLLLSYYDPSLPIIIFSSTQQRSVLSMFAGRPNIITDFAKPAPTGYAAEVRPREYVEDFCRAVKKAAEFAPRRLVWQRLARLARRDIPTSQLSARRSSTVGGLRTSPLTLTIDSAFVKLVAGECERTLLHGHYADALQVPHNILEARYYLPMPPTVGASDPNYAEYLYWAVMAFCRHARAHYCVTAADDAAVARIATWLWLWFVTGILAYPLTTGRLRIDVPHHLRVENDSGGVAAFDNLFDRIDMAQSNGVTITDASVRDWLRRMRTKATPVVGKPPTKRPRRRRAQRI